MTMLHLPELHPFADVLLHIRLSPAQYSLTSAESRPNTPFIHSYCKLNYIQYIQNMFIVSFFFLISETAPLSDGLPIGARRVLSPLVAACGLWRASSPRRLCHSHHQDTHSARLAPWTTGGDNSQADQGGRHWFDTEGGTRFCFNCRQHITRYVCFISYRFKLPQPKIYVPRIFTVIVSIELANQVHKFIYSQMFLHIRR